MTALSLTERLAQHLQRPVPDETRAAARLHLLDWMGCVAGARRGDVARLPHGRAHEDIVGVATLLGNVLEMDDVHRAALLHPGPVVWPAVVGQAVATMDVMLDAAVRGYEAMIAIGETFDGAHYAYWHNSASAGGFGAAAAVASLRAANIDAIADALGLAGSVAGGLWQMRHEPVMAKQWHLAHAVATGRAAADHAMRGVTGPRRVLEGPQGLYAATCRDPRPMSFGQEWRLHEVSFKPWGACRHAHPAIDAALSLKARGGLSGPIVVESYADALNFCDRPDPYSVIDAKFSIHHAVAIVAERGEPELKDFEPDAISALAAARTRVTVRESAEFTGRYPAHFGARVTCGSDSVTLVDTLGDPERPLAHEGVVAKARALMRWGGVDDALAKQGVAAALTGTSPAAVGAWLEAIL